MKDFPYGKCHGTTHEDRPAEYFLAFGGVRFCIECKGVWDSLMANRPLQPYNQELHASRTGMYRDLANQSPSDETPSSRT